jgi:DNA-binding transcriptional MerR regulator
MELRIDDLAVRAGVPSRTIRYYTQQGLLPPPSLRGRVGYYSEQHLDRLKLIKELQEKRFLPLSLIRSVLRRYEQGIDLETMLAPLDMVFAPRWDNGQQLQLTRAELALQAGVGPEVVDEAEEMGFLFPAREGRELRYTSDDVHMLEVARDWMRLGLPVQLGHVYRHAFEEIAREQVKAFGQAVVAPLEDAELTPEEVRELLVEGYKRMSATCSRVASMLHRKLLQRAVEISARAANGDR